MHEPWQAIDAPWLARIWPQYNHERPILFGMPAGQRFPLMSFEKSIANPSFGSFVQALRHAAEAVRVTKKNPWEPTLQKLKGRIGLDGVERLSTAQIFDLLEVPMRRRPSLTVRLSRVMLRLGWTNIRARGLNPGSYRDRVRGYAR